MGHRGRRFAGLHPLILAAALFALAGVLSGCATSSTFESQDADDYHQIMTGKYRSRSVRLSGQLVVPEAKAGKVPAVVIVPGSGGATAWIDGYFAEALQRAGIATFRIDSFSGRGVTETATDQSRVSMPASVLDGFNALRFLASNPAIDSARVGITGFSRGGTVAVFTAEERLARAVLPPELRFAAHVAFYPACSTYWENPRPTKAPLLVLLGEKDDYTGVDQCAAYVERLRARGARVDLKIYADAHHGWMSDAPVRRIDVPTFLNCAFRVRDDGRIADGKTGIVPAGTWREGVRYAMQSCAGRGATYGANPEARKQALGDMVRFFKSSFGLP
ncbi:MAG TPA: dienelactone hydrolase family protein [Burkholderiales bacterium]